MAPRNQPLSQSSGGHFLAEWLEHLDIEYVDLAGKLGVNKSTVTRWTSGERQLKTVELRRVARALGIKPDALLHHPADTAPAARVSRIEDDVLAEMLKKSLGG